MTPELVAELNAMFIELEKTVKVKKVRATLQRLNQIISRTTGGAVTFVSWNS